MVMQLCFEDGEERACLYKIECLLVGNQKAMISISQS